MRSLRTVSPLLIGFGLTVGALTIAAQRDGAAPRPGPAAPHPVVRPAPAMHPGTPPTHLHSGAPSSRGTYYSNPGSLFLPPGITSTRPVYFSNGIARYSNEPRHERRSGYGSLGFVTFGYPSDLGLDEDPEFLDTSYNPNTAQDAFPATAAETLAGPQPQAQGLSEPLPDPPPDTYREPQHAAPRDVAAPEPRREPEPKPLPEEDAVTIIFKDGRPSEQVRNYALTRTALYVTAGRVRTIPMDQIDVIATEAANAKAGVEFHLPSKQ